MLNLIKNDFKEVFLICIFAFFIEDAKITFVRKSKEKSV